MNRIAEKFQKLYSRIPTKPLVNMVFGLIMRIVITYIVDMDAKQRKSFGLKLKRLGLDIIESAAEGAVRGAKDA